MLLFEVIKFFILIGFTTSVDGFDKDDPNGVKQLDFIRKLNEMRKSVATKAKISNMHELTYNEEIAKNKTLPKRFNFLNGSYEGGVEYLVKFTESYLNKTKEEKRAEVKRGSGSNSYVASLEHFNPLQTDIGCFKYTEVNVVNIICFFGFENTCSSFESFRNKHSRCKEGFIKNDTLCVRIVSGFPAINSTTSPTPAPPTTPATTPFKPPEVVVIPSKTDNEKTPKPVPSDAPETETTQRVVPQKKKEPEPTPAKPTEMSEIDKKVKAYLESEKDGDDYDEDDRTTTETSSSGTSSQMVLAVFFVIFCVFLDSF